MSEVQYSGTVFFEIHQFRVVADYATWHAKETLPEIRQVVVSFDKGTGFLSFAQFRKITGYNGIFLSTVGSQLL